MPIQYDSTESIKTERMYAQNSLNTPASHSKLWSMGSFIGTCAVPGVGHGGDDEFEKAEEEDDDEESRIRPSVRAGVLAEPRYMTMTGACCALRGSRYEERGTWCSVRVRVRVRVRSIIRYGVDGDEV